MIQLNSTVGKGADPRKYEVQVRWATKENRGVWRGCRSSGAVDGGELAREALGPGALGPVSGLVAFAYLYRRFGPPNSECDRYKEIAVYHLPTEDAGVVLTVYPSASPLHYGVGWLVPARDWEVLTTRYPLRLRRKSDKEAVRVRAALLGALRRLLEPVRVRDVEINVLGVIP